MQVATSTSRSQYRPRVGGGGVRPPLAARAANAGHRPSRAPGENQRDEAATKNVKDIVKELQKRPGFYESKLLFAGIAPHELDDAFAELTMRAIASAHTYDQSRGTLSTWIGNAIVRTVASAVYGKGRPGWRLQQAQEVSTEVLGGQCSDSDDERPFEGADNSRDPSDMLTTAAFLHIMSAMLNKTEKAAIEICGDSFLVERRTEAQLTRLRKLLRVDSNTSARQYLDRLANKVCALAVEQFGVEALQGRIGCKKFIN
ncbi:hypothetical protein PQR68_23325 [Paraburkholderia agricolaris]|uniref:hypothetical protein n=1 Tax=Paraburkholderia agricolaris TaxID=2152888 RepID=UPI0038B814F2